MKKKTIKRIIAMNIIANPAIRNPLQKDFLSLSFTIWCSLGVSGK